MSYSCYLGGVEWPTPAKLTVKIKGKNKTLTLLNEGEINFLRTPGLSEIVLPVTLSMLTGSRSPSYYMGVLERLKTSKGTTQFILVRRSPDGRRLFDTNMTVSVEDYNITEDAKEGLDVSVDINLKQWRSYGTKTAKVEQPSTDTGKQTVTVEKERDASTAPSAKTYTVKKGDTLWAISAKYYGAGAQYTKIYGANTDKISNPQPHLSWAGAHHPMSYELLIQHGSNIMYPPTVEGVTIEWERKGQPGKLTFEVVKTPGLSFQEGDPCRFSVDGTPVFYGFVFEKSRKGQQPPMSSSVWCMTSFITSKIKIPMSTPTRRPLRSSKWWRRTSSSMWESLRTRATRSPAVWRTIKPCLTSSKTPWTKP